MWLPARRSREWAAFGALALLFGSAFLWTRLALAELGPSTLVAGRLLLGLLALAPIAAWRRQAIPRDLRTLAAFAGMAVLNTALPFVLISWAQQRIDSAVAAVLIGTMPLFTILLAHYVLDDERLTLPRLAGLTVGFLGVMVLFGRDLGAGLQRAAILDQAAVLVAAASYAGAVVLARKRLRGQPPLAQAVMVLLIADVLVWAGVMAWESPLRLPTQPITWLALGALGVFGSCVAYLLYFYLIAAWDATRASTVLYFVTIVGLLLGVTVLGEPLDAWLVVGTALVVGGVALTHARGLSRAGLTGVLGARGRDMDFNEYAALMIVRERHAEMIAAARRDALVRSSTPRRRTFRAALGTTLIRLGAWLLREHYPATASR